MTNGVLPNPDFRDLTLSPGVIDASGMAKELHTVGEVISELGGFAVVQEMTRREGKFTVQMWKNRNRFPPNTYTILKSALQERGITAPDNLWGML